MLRLVEFLSRGSRLLLFSALLGMSWIYQNEINAMLGLNLPTMVNRVIQLLIVGITALAVGTPINWGFGKLLARLEKRTLQRLHLC
nr:hypothetical protein [Pseudomonas aeruginosa]EIU2864240.1 hypothetical protein [Pseudomonas aeruginosa]